MATITSFKTQGRKRLVIEVHLDGAPWATLDAEAVVRAGLKTGQVLAPADQQRVLLLDETIRARKAAAGTNARSPKTRREIERYLEGKKFSPQAIEGAVEALEASGTLDSARVASRMASQSRRRRVGPRRLKAELLARGVEPELAEAEVRRTFEDSDLAAECLALANKAAAKYQPLTDPKQRRKLEAWLMRRGYPEEAIRAALGRLSHADQDD